MANENDKNNPQLQINGDSSINSIVKEFSFHYPFLKINFLKNYFKNAISSKGSLSEIELSKKIGSNREKKVININKTRTVLELEKELENIFGLAVLIFRKSGNVWVETSLTEDWTLEEQNKAGEQISCHFY